jgi:hypothetical protein
MRQHPFPHKRQARNIDVMAPSSQRRLRNRILQLGYRATAIHHNGAASTKLLQRPRIADINSHRRYYGTKVRCNSL